MASEKCGSIGNLREATLDFNQKSLKVPKQYDIVMGGSIIFYFSGREDTKFQQFLEDEILLDLYKYV